MRSYFPVPAPPDASFFISCARDRFLLYMGLSGASLAAVPNRSMALSMAPAMARENPSPLYASAKFGSSRMAISYSRMASPHSCLSASACARLKCFSGRFGFSRMEIRSSSIAWSIRPFF